MKGDIMSEEKKCLRCGGTNVKPGALQSTGKIYARPKNAKLETLFTTGALVNGNPAGRTETNNDGGPGGLDHAEWVAVWNGVDPVPSTTWDTATNLGNAGFGFDPGWTGNVVNISDADAWAYAAENKVEIFDDVLASVAVSTVDTDEEFGLLLRASDFGFFGAGIEDVTAYAVTFNANDGIDNEMEFNLYKIVDGVVVHTVSASPQIPAGFDDYIMFLELSAVDNYIRARLYEDADMSNLLADIDYTDGSPLVSGYTGVINLDGAVLDGIDSYWDTLSSVSVPEPATFGLLIFGALTLLRKHRTYFVKRPTDYTIG